MMAYTIVEAGGADAWIKLSGILTVGDFRALQQLGRKSIEQFGRFCALIELENFQGWSHDADGWQETSFLIDEKDRLSKLAFVGDPRWKDEVFLFVGQPLRSRMIEYFQPGQLAEARLWLAETD